MHHVFTTEYLNKDGDNVETTSCIDLRAAEGRRRIMSLFVEWLDHVQYAPDHANFRVGGLCTVHKESQCL